MNLDRVISWLAPHNCIVCGAEGYIVCVKCESKVISPKRSTCYMCNKLTQNWRTCSVCARKTDLKGIVVASHYEGYMKQLIGLLKFQHNQAAAGELAKLVAPQVTASQFDLILPVPAATSRLRQRGYNPAYLITKQLSYRLSLPPYNNLRRLGQSRQVGTDRRKRFDQIKGKIYLVKPQVIKGARVLVVDDVVTTGATMTECARALKQAGAKSVWGIAAAKH